MTKNRPIHIPAFAELKRADGGVKRSNQLRTIARENGRLIIESPSARDLLATFFKSPVYWLSGAFLFLRLIKYANLRKSPALLLQSVWLYRQVRRHQPTEIHIETTRNLLGLAYMCALMGPPLVVYPHNIEFMVPGQRNAYCRSKLAALALELEVYRKATSVETISNFDTAVLRSFDIDQVQTLEFEPLGPALSRLLSIKDQRRDACQEGILILGTVHNIPTRIGMERLLKIIAESSLERKYTLAGNGTERLKAISPACVNVQGTVDEQELCRLLIHCEALLIYQPPTSGMLTRIIEAAVAGIPVYVMGGYIQPFALRDRGVHMITSLSELPG